MKKKKTQKHCIDDIIERQWRSYIAKIYEADKIKPSAKELEHLHAAFLGGTCLGAAMVASRAEKEMIGIGVYGVINAFEPKGKKK